MAITKQKKSEIFEKLESIIENAKNISFVKFGGMSVPNVTRVRGELYEQGVGYVVAKKTLIKRVLETKGFSGEIPELPGEIALAYSEDELAASREIYRHGKKLKDAFMLVGGVFEGNYKNKEEMIKIAMIPPLDVLRGMFVNVINSPLQRTAIALSEIAKTKV